MIIKLGEHNVREGETFLRYVMSDCYDRGEVIKVNGDTIHVDFRDTIREFSIVEVSRVFSEMNDEHLMTCVEGKIIKDYRRTGPDTLAQIKTVEDLLDFENWMV